MADAATEKTTAESRSIAAESLGLSAIQRAVVLTVIYSDLFNYPLTEEELHRYLVLTPADRAELRTAIASLLGRHLETDDGFICLAGRSEATETRRRHNALAEERWTTATRYGRRLAKVPFVRLVAVCGSQAAHNPSEKSDLDFFCVTAAGRLWLVQICAMVLRHIAGLFSLRVCPNYFLTVDNLEVGKHDLFGAREVAQTVPLHGVEVYDAFLAANRWSAELLPNQSHDGRRERLADVETPTLTRWAERLLGGRLGGLLDAIIYRLLLFYYPIRLRHLGWRKEEFRQFYRRDRQLVMTGGYSGEVERQFRRAAAERLGAAAVAADLERLFPGSSSGARTKSDPLYSQLYHQSYGNRRG